MRCETQGHHRTHHCFSDDREQEDTDRERQTYRQKPGYQTDDQPFDNYRLHDDNIHRTDGSHHADFTCSLQDIDAHRACQTNAAHKCSQDRHDQQENNQSVDRLVAFACKQIPGLHTLNRKCPIL